MSDHEKSYFNEPQAFKCNLVVSLSIIFHTTVPHIKEALFKQTDERAFPFGHMLHLSAKNFMDLSSNCTKTLLSS